MNLARLPKFVLVLGPAGLLPRLIALLVMMLWPEWRWLALTSATLYAAAILSFLGGLWWMQGLTSPSGDGLPYGMGVLPALLAWLVPLFWSVSLRWLLAVGLGGLTLVIGLLA